MGDNESFLAEMILRLVPLIDKVHYGNALMTGNEYHKFSRDEVQRLIAIKNATPRAGEPHYSSGELVDAANWLNAHRLDAISVEQMVREVLARAPRAEGTAGTDAPRVTAEPTGYAVINRHGDVMSCWTTKDDAESDASEISYSVKGQDNKPYSVVPLYTELSLVAWRLGKEDGK